MFASASLLSAIGKLELLRKELKDHPQNSDFNKVVKWFCEFKAGFLRQDPLTICELADQIDKPNWLEMKNKALEVAKSIDSNLTMDIFPEDTCRSFIPICRIQTEDLTDEEKKRRILIYFLSSISGK